MNKLSVRTALALAAAIGCCLATVGVCARPELPDIAPNGPADRVLILAPHEDDETLGAGGLIQQAVEVGARVRVVYLTYGDHNEMAFILYRKRPWLTPAINRDMGEVRHHEAIEAMAHLGVSAENLVFLGFPDHGTLAIWRENWGKSPPMHSTLTNTRRVPYKDAYCYDKPYKGEEIVAAIENQLLDFRPTRVLVPHWLDSNPDHRAYYLFLQVALLESVEHMATPQVLTYPIHMGPWPRRVKYQPEEWLQLPRILVEEPSADWMFELTPQQVQRKYEAICMYKTQTTENKSWLTAFARRNELFSTPKPTLLETEIGPTGTSWSPTKRVFPTPNTEAYEQESATNHLYGVAFRQSQNDLVIQMKLRRPLEDALSLSIYAFGVRHDRPFGAMPKLHIQWQSGSSTVHDQKTVVRNNGVQVHAASQEIIALVPWSTMGLPDAVFVQVQGLVSEVPISQTGWQVLTRAPFISARSKQ